MFECLKNLLECNKLQIERYFASICLELVSGWLQNGNTRNLGGRLAPLKSVVLNNGVILS